jgi:hypothetical protein
MPKVPLSVGIQTCESCEIFDEKMADQENAPKSNKSVD